MASRDKNSQIRGKCNKRRFTYHEADAAIEKARKSQSPNRHEIRFYECFICNCYHLTSKKRSGEEMDIILKHSKEFKKYLG